jgi:hypothetical protein
VKVEATTRKLAMISSLQPSRPKVYLLSSTYQVFHADARKPPQQQSPLPTHAHQQHRAIHTAPQHPFNTPSSPTLNPPRPRSQIEAMPPFGPPQTPATFFAPVYDSAIRHPVFFTQNLKKPPFPIPQVASQGYNPVASGYIMEQRRVEEAGRTKL